MVFNGYNVIYVFRFNYLDKFFFLIGIVIKRGWWWSGFGGL